MSAKVNQPNNRTISGESCHCEAAPSHTNRIIIVIEDGCVVKYLQQNIPRK